LSAPNHLGRRMDKTADFFADQDVPRARVALPLKHFSRLEDDRELWRIAYPLAEVMLLLTCAIIASCDDFDEDATPRSCSSARQSGPNV
jgi:hypothetical protein